ncbi:MAG: hypothetical protein CMB64_02760 [Euryarchaeota archaeon]|nr:hypothetical protein [Euryarchaeota archaeon]
MYMVRHNLMFVVLLFSILSPFVVGDSVAGSNEIIKLDDLDCGIEYFSPAVWASYTRVADMSSYSNDQLSSTFEWVFTLSSGYCSLDSDSISKWANGIDASLQSKAGKLDYSWIIEFNHNDAEKAINHFSNEEFIDSFYPLVPKKLEKKLVPNDPNYGEQWHLENIGQDGGNNGEDANITGAWDTATGTGVTIGIVDDGLDHAHPDLTGNYLSAHSWDYCNGDSDPTPDSSNDGHGTSAAGVAAAIGNNGIGVSGAALDANLVGLTLIACSNSDSTEASALGHDKQDIDIYSNSWGPSDSVIYPDDAGPLMHAEFEDDAINGRGGLGNIITWAAGNGLASNDDSNLDGYANSRFTIAVTAVHDRGAQSWYAEPGANIIVAAPSDGRDGIYTTDIEGSWGYSNGDYTDDFGGTSSATPLVSGVIALMLEANPNLTWRDIQHLLVHSSRQNDASEPGWNTNGAGHEYNHKYGFGVIDAGAAVSLASTWNTVSTETIVDSGVLSVNGNIPDNTNNGLTDSIVISDSISVETVEVIFDADHNSRGDLEVSLVSPSGTVSYLANERSDNGNDYNNWRFSTVLNWDEDSAGTWTLNVRDQDSGTTGTWNNWRMTIYGSELDGDPDNDGLLNSEELSYGTDPNDADTDDDGLLDGIEVLTTFTDPLLNDTDQDNLLDGDEILIYGTDPLLNDTDSDGLKDGYEITVSFSDPLIYDADEDLDSWYWFWDCNDTNELINPSMNELLNGFDDNCNDEIDEGYNNSDVDLDGLNDWDEYYIYGTNYTNPDTEGDGLSDGDEILNWSSDPLYFDEDLDLDSSYWFVDCNDTNPMVYPNAPERINGIDDDCDDLIDEDFIGKDSDGDGLYDLTEVMQFGTDPLLTDTDGDGMTDGDEILVFNTNPLIGNYDYDGDGFRDFLDCDDDNVSVNPAQPERWNQIDDNCNGYIDEGLTPPEDPPDEKPPLELEFIFVNIPNNGFVDTEVSMTAYAKLSLESNETVSYEWVFGDSSIDDTNELTQYHTYLISGTYSVEVCAVVESIDSVCRTNTIVIGEIPKEIILQNNSDEINNSDDVSQKGTEAASGGLDMSTNSLVGLGALVVVVLIIGFLIGRGRDGSPPSQISIPQNFTNDLTTPPQINQYEVQPPPQMYQYEAQQPPQMYQYEVQQPPQIPSFDPGILK